MTSPSQHVLVTGGAGYIGSHTCKLLAQQGFKPIAFDNLVYGHEWAVQWGPLEIGDLQDKARIDEVIKKYQPIAVIHFAAFAYVGESVDEPAKYYRNNVSGSLNLLESMKEHGVQHLIFSSTCATYGNPKSIPITEDHPQNPINPYGNSKLIMEQMMADFSHAYDLNYVALRYFNAAGADIEGQIGEDHDPETHLIPLVIEVALGQRSHIQVFGDDYDTPDGSCVRDYIHVTDLAQAHIQALNYLRNGGDSTAYNLGNGQGFSVKEIIEATQRVTGKEIKAVITERRPGDPASLVGDSSRIKQALNWQPQYADIDTILDSAWQWHKKHSSTS